MSQVQQMTPEEREARNKENLQRAAASLQYAGHDNKRDPTIYGHFSDSRMQRRMMQICELKVQGIAQEATQNVPMAREGWDKYFFFADNPVKNLGRKRPARSGDNTFAEGKEELATLVKTYATKKESDNMRWCRSDGTLYRDGYRRWSQDPLCNARERTPATFLKHIFPNGHICFDEQLANLDYKQGPRLDIAKNFG